MLGKDMFEIWYANADAQTKAELESVKGNELEIRERFGADLAFGTAGLRGFVGAGTFRMNTYTVARATLGLARFIVSLGATAMEKGVVISYDTRRCSLLFAQKAAKVLAQNGVKCHIFDDVHPVPMCSFAVRHTGAAAGIMITASHNPKEYNGFKVYGSDGAQMSPEDTAQVVSFIEEQKDYFAIEEAQVTFPESIKGLDGFKVGEHITVIGKAVDEAYYAEIDKLSLSAEAVAAHGKDIKLVYTPIHGTGYVPVTTVLKRMGINVACVPEQILPDTEFSTVLMPNPENPDALRLGIELGNRIGADVVIGTDPDCDRMGLAVRDGSGNFRLLNGNQIGVLLMDYVLTRLSESGALPDNGAVIKTIVTTTLTDKIAQNYNVKVIDVLTGFKFIGEKIKEWEESKEYTFLFGYEESYGYLRGTHARDKDAVVASMLTAEMACYYQSKGKGLFGSLTELYEKYGYYREDTASIAYKGISAMDDMAKAMARLRLKTITSFAGKKVVYAADFKKGVTTYPDGRTENILLPETDALKFGLEDGQFVCIRPSGTEPKLKVYVLCRELDEKSAALTAESLMSAVRAEL